MNFTLRENSIVFYILAAGFFGLPMIVFFLLLNLYFDIDVQHIFYNIIFKEALLSGFLLFLTLTLFQSIFYIYMDFKNRKFSYGSNITIFIVLLVILYFDFNFEDTKQMLGYEFNILSIIGIFQGLFLLMLVMMLKDFSKKKFIVILLGCLPFLKLIYLYIIDKTAFSIGSLIYLLFYYIFFISSILVFNLYLKKYLIDIYIRKFKILNIFLIIFEVIFFPFAIMNALYFTIL